LLIKERDQLAAERDLLRQQLSARDANAAKPAPPAPWEPVYLDVCVGGKMVGVPIEVKEYGPDGKPVGGAKLDGDAMLVRYLTRLRKDPDAPKDLRIVIWEDAPNDRIKAALRACLAAGFAEAVLHHGKVPTNDPDITFTPPANDPGGIRDGWFEADEVRVKLDKLVKP
jgi:hypothetical protein